MAAKVVESTRGAGARNARGPAQSPGLVELRAPQLCPLQVARALRSRQCPEECREEHQQYHPVPWIGYDMQGDRPEMIDVGHAGRGHPESNNEQHGLPECAERLPAPPREQDDQGAKR